MQVDQWKEEGHQVYSQGQSKERWTSSWSQGELRLLSKESSQVQGTLLLLNKSQQDHHHDQTLQRHERSLLLYIPRSIQAVYFQIAPLLLKTMLSSKDLNCLSFQGKDQYVLNHLD